MWGFWGSFTSRLNASKNDHVTNLSSDQRAAAGSPRWCLPSMTGGCARGPSRGEPTSRLRLYQARVSSDTGTLDGLAIPPRCWAPAPLRIDAHLQPHAALCFDRPSILQGAASASSLRNASSTCIMSCWTHRTGGRWRSRNSPSFRSLHGCVRCDGKELIDSVRFITADLSGSIASEYRRWRDGDV